MHLETSEIKINVSFDFALMKHSKATIQFFPYRSAQNFESYIFSLEMTEDLKEIWKDLAKRSNGKVNNHTCFLIKKDDWQMSIMFSDNTVYIGHDVKVERW